MRVSDSYIARLVRDYRQAFQASNDKPPPDLVWERGWFILGKQRYRRTRLEEMLANLRWRAWNERGIDCSKLNQQEQK